jgi:amidase
MDRRKFLKSGTVAGVAAASIAIGSCNSPENNQKTVENPSSGVPDFELDEITIAGLQTRMKSGELTSRAITEMYLKRILMRSLSLTAWTPNENQGNYAVPCMGYPS